MKLKVRALFFVFLAVLLSCKDEEQPDFNKIDYSDCVTSGSEDKLEVVTFNMREFPLSGGETIIYSSDLFNQMNVDIIAVQEISYAYELDKLTQSMSGWKFLFSPVTSWKMSLGFLYKTSEIELIEAETEALFTDDRYSFPRPPLKIKFTHIPTGESIFIINNHLKCCGGDDNIARRRSAADKLKEYIDTYLSDSKVIVVGDMNDRIDGTEEENNVFWSFIQDSISYRFADMNIAKGNSNYWSYPSFPSHIDHLLITNECFDSVDTVFTVRPDMCVPEFRSIVSDHRPVEMVMY